jgi:hypothetical protein
MTITSVYNEVAMMIAELNPSKIIDFKASESSVKQLQDLLEKNSGSKITTDESYQLDRLLALEQLMSLAKAHARVMLKT